ncbi:hypothetical protein [Dyadobacter aurulentus]|uniref:hypothetical protein n=1 Tax=Dyadobacter sp. UC 10 TaxID=2605428 RepID=UPI0011F38F4F|nr:hypothetical protein [Dyadobacter sp. UC 10]KAA0990167.1 hypothetical protein FXO21_08345 [Dyadobacter sp. UC 10]
MKRIAFLVIILFPLLAAAQDQALQKGKSVYVETNKTDVGKSAGQELKSALAEWGYWKVASSKSDADVILKLDTKISGGVTWTSWGGKAVALSALFVTKDDREIWQSEYYKAAPNGANGFNSQSASVRKLVKGLRKKFE